MTQPMIPLHSACLTCDGPLSAERGHARHCSNRCRSAAYRERRNAAPDLLRRLTHAIEEADAPAVSKLVQEAHGVLGSSRERAPRQHPEALTYEVVEDAVRHVLETSPAPISPEHAESRHRTLADLDASREAHTIARLARETRSPSGW